MNRIYDIIFVGAGISCTYTLVHLLNHFNISVKNGNKLKILIVDKDKEFWTGIPYGNRSGKDSLIITPLKDFIPKADSAFFFSWLKQTFTNILKNDERDASMLMNIWLQKNRNAIERNSWEDLYIPRYWFGLFIKERITGLLEEAVKKDLIEYDLLNATIDDIQKNGSFYEVITDDPMYEIINKCKKVVLSIGSPPEKLFNNRVNNTDKRQPPIFIENIYDKGLPAALKLIRGVLADSDTKRKNVLIIGSNASSLELIYNLGDEILKEVYNLYVISSSGRFPGRIKEGISQHVFIPEHLTSLKKLEDLTAEQLFASFLNDLKIIENCKVDIEYTYLPVNALIAELVNKLNSTEQDKFVTTYGREIGKYYRRAGGEYSNKVTKLQKCRKMKCIQGEFISANASGVQYKNITDATIINLILPLTIVINCSGPGNLETESSTSALIDNLIKSELCKLNSSKRGFSVNSQFEADKNFYVMGPLLAGNVIGVHKIWHAESCNRIFNLTFDLANQLLKTA
ncbi:FAD/NAD(P)-binding protein [Mucilaginibacter sabulilitoris]|uniref:FAD/NAD(P)-binding protein n=1 Tax=Mucilaginibacter sabulilitoris TaxID=1173583 RepID=A0ABZ0TRJ1_9SPHI|nr:FAD/NAD(P)-binding protein [Mucilaginibacter sabulilitoris]WPU95529.1 FAD/NAD(P)-binding protein [Mucilaginibacter sabulilitoris]